MTCISTGGWYPWVICHAVAMVDDLPAFRTLPDSYGQVLRRLIKKVGKDDGKRAILARRQTIAEEAGKSVETVYRALREFETRGWIEQREKKAGDGLLGSDSEISFTKRLCDLLDLPYEGKAKKPRTTPREQPPVINDRSNSVIVVSSIQPSLKEQPAELEQNHEKLSTMDDQAVDSSPVKLEIKTQHKESGWVDDPNIVRIEGKSVPKELVWLVQDCGLSLSGLFSLMKQARNKNKLLSDVVECVKQYLGKLEGRALFAYLSKLISLERDFAWEVRQRGEKETEAKQKEIDKDRLTAALTKLHGQWFMSKRSGSIFEVDRGSIRKLWFDDSGRVREGYKPVNSAFLDAIEAGSFARCDKGSTPVWMEG